MSKQMPAFHKTVCFILLCVVISPMSLSYGQEDHLTYRYKLVLNNNPSVCSHMAKVYNHYFKRPWLDTPYLKEARDLVAAENYNDIIYSLHPTSPEFDAIHWTPGRYESNGHFYAMLSAMFDIDNDGIDDLVIKNVFFTGSVDTSDFLTILRKGAVDLTSPVKSENIPEGNLILGGRLIRPFILDGMTYLSVYIDTENHKVMFEQPEAMWVKKYLGGSRRNGTAKFQDICEFKMIHTDDLY